MRKIIGLSTIVFFSMTGLLPASLCTTGQHTNNPHCQGHTASSGTIAGEIKLPGMTPDSSTTNPHTGTIIPEHHNTHLVPAEPIPTPTATPQPVPQQVPQPTPIATPQRVPTQVVIGDNTPKPTSQTSIQPTHHILVHNHATEKPITSGPHVAETGYNFNVIEPGIQNKQVAVYRSNDAREMLYKDTIILDNTGFLFIDLGIRDPDYVK